jgi:putative nucleotidyltransferase with HDIG domain
MITRSEALDLLHLHMQSPNLRRHCYAVEAVMRALSKKFGGNEEKWGIAGLLHDADYEETKETATKNHVHTVLTWLKEKNADPEIINAIYAHGWKYVENCPEPKNNMEWSLYCCDELTGFIVAVALVKGKLLSNVEVASVLKRFPEKKFAAAVSREQIRMCQEKLKIPIHDFVQIALSAMQEVHTELGL